MQTRHLDQWIPVVALPSHAPVILTLLQYFLLLRCARHMSVMGDIISALRIMIRVRKLVCACTGMYRRYHMFSPFAHVRMRALKGLACRAHVTAASSHASPCSGEAFTLPACHACGSTSPVCACVCSMPYGDACMLVLCSCGCVRPVCMPSIDVCARVCVHMCTDM
jgi:hypothetical protein